MKNLQECLSYLSDIDFDRDTLKAARAELADVTQRANAALPPINADAVWDAAVEAAAKFAKESARRIRAEAEAKGGNHSIVGGVAATTLENFAAHVVSALKRDGTRNEH